MMIDLIEIDLTNLFPAWDILLQDRLSWNTNSRCARRNIINHHRSGTHLRSRPDSDSTKDTCVTTNEDAISYFRVPWLWSRPNRGHLEYRTVCTDLAQPDDDGPAMNHDQPGSNDRVGAEVNAR